MMGDLLMIFWIFLPAGIANMAPVFFKRLPILNYPIDGGLSWGDKRILGDNKTWRGLVAGILLAIIAVWLQSIIYPTTLITSGIMIAGILLGGGALIGDIVKSFFKRRLNIAPGQSFPVADQIDWIVGALIATSFIQLWSWQTWLVAILMFGLLHLVVNLIGYWLGIKGNRF